MTINVLFINAINPNAEVETRHPPLGLGYLASSLRSFFGSEQFNFKIISDSLEIELADFKPNIVGITAVSQNYHLAQKYAKQIKAKGIPVLIGGIHISMLPDSLSHDMDVGIIGEAEETIIDLFKLFMDKQGFHAADLAGIKGVIYWNNNLINFTGKRELIRPLDKIPLPARDLLKIDKHSYLFSSRGCPYRCVFCASSRYWDEVRYFSAKYVVNEIKELVNKYNVKLISFYDDLMMADKQRLREIVRLLKEANMLTKIAFTANARANVLSEEMVQLLREMNVVCVSMGLESGCPRILKYLKGNNVTVADNSNAIKMLKKYGIAANASFIIGSPDETAEEILETFQFIKKSDLDLFEAYLLTPYPGTPLWEEAKKRGLVADNMDWENLNIDFAAQPKRSIILSNVLTRVELYRLFRKFRYYGIWRICRNIFHHPLAVDIPRMVIRKIIGKYNMLINRLRQKRIGQKLKQQFGLNISGDRANGNDGSNFK